MTPAEVIAMLDKLAEEAGLRCFAAMSRKPERKEAVAVLKGETDGVRGHDNKNQEGTR